MQGAGGGVILPAQVSQHEAAGAAFRHAAGEGGGVLVGQVAPPAQDALLQGVGVRPGQQPLHIVVALQHQQVYAGESGGRRLRHEAGIGEDAHRLTAAVDAVVHALPRVVAGGEHRHLCGANGKDAAGGYKAQVIVQPRQAAAEIEGRAAAGVQRDGMVLQEGGKARRVICMLMGDEDGGQVVRRQIQQSKGLLDAAGGDAGIHQQVDAAGGDQQAVALGAAGQCMYRDQSGMYLSGK